MSEKNYPKAFPDAEIIYRSNKPDGILADRLASCVSSLSPTSVPGKEGQWIVTEVFLARDELIVRGIAAIC